MKKIIVIVLSLLLVAGLFACKPAETPDDGKGTTASQNDSKPAESKTPDTQPGTEKPDTEAPIVVTEEPVATYEPIPEVPESGFCAIGQVDEANTKVAVVLWSGKVKTFTYDGSVPTTGAIAYYEIAGDVIAFEEVVLEDYQYWRLQDQEVEYFYGNDGTNDLYVYFADRCVCFLKFSDTNWNVYNERGNLFEVSLFDYAWPSTVWPCGLQALDYDGDGNMDVLLADATHTYDYSQYSTSGGDNFVNITYLFNGQSEEITEGTLNAVIE